MSHIEYANAIIISIPLSIIPKKYRLPITPFNANHTPATNAVSFHD